MRSLRVNHVLCNEVILKKCENQTLLRDRHGGNKEVRQYTRSDVRGQRCRRHAHKGVQTVEDSNTGTETPFPRQKHSGGPRLCGPDDVHIKGPGLVEAWVGCVLKVTSVCTFNSGSNVCLRMFNHIGKSGNKLSHDTASGKKIYNPPA